MYCLINEGKKKKYKYWAAYETADQTSIVLCYGSIDDREVVAGKVTDMKTNQASAKRASPHAEMLKRVRKKFDEGYETAPSDIRKVIEAELKRKYGAEFFSQEEKSKSSGQSASAPKEDKQNKEKTWKPSDNFAWF